MLAGKRLVGFAAFNFKAFSSLSKPCQAFQAKSDLEGLSGWPGEAKGRGQSASMVWPALKGGTSPGPWTPGAAGFRGHSFQLFRYPGALLFSIVFSMPFCIHLGSILAPNLEPTNHQNQEKLDTKMASQVDFIFDWLIVNLCFQLPPLNLKNRAPAEARARFSKKSHFEVGIGF